MTEKVNSDPKQHCLRRLHVEKLFFVLISGCILIMVLQTSSGKSLLGEIKHVTQFNHSADIQTMFMTALSQRGSRNITKHFFSGSPPAYNPNQPQANVVFSKVHKAASSTIHNILLRYALNHNKNVLLPRNDMHLNERGSKLPKSKVVPIPEGDTYNILANHLIFNYTEISKYFPPSNLTKYVAILRHPLERSLSAIVYYHTVWNQEDVIKAVKKHKPDPLAYYVKHPFSFTSEMKPLNFLGDAMSIDLGYTSTDYTKTRNNKTLIDNFVKYIDDRFDLIMIAEMFDESMILLRRLLNWELKDVLSVRVNSKEDFKSKAPKWTEMRTFTSNDSQKYLEKFAVLDNALYSHFIKKFKRKIAEEPLFQEELKQFRLMKSSVKKFCEDQTMPDMESLKKASSLPCPLTDLRLTMNINDMSTPVHLDVEANRWSGPFRITTRDCFLMTVSEISMTQMMTKCQNSRNFASIRKTNIVDFLS